MTTTRQTYALRVPALMFGALALLVALAWPGVADAATHRVVAAKGHPVLGIVASGGPVSGARVTLFDTRGRVITHTPVRTNQRGVFVLRLHRALPRTFTVRSVGGRDRRGRVLGALRSNYATYRRGEPVIVNNATTLAAVYQAAHPKLKPAVVEARIERFLHLPTSVDLRTSLTLSDTAFHGPTFTRAARQHVEGYSRRLVRGIDRGQRKAFRKAPLRPAAKAGATSATFGRSGRSGVSAMDLQISNTTFINATTMIVGKIPEIGGAAAPIIGLFMGAILGTDPDPELVQLQQIEAKLDAVQASLNFAISAQHDAARRADYNAYSVSVNAGVLPRIEAASHTAWILYTTAMKEQLDPAARQPGSAGALEAKAASDTFLAYYNDSNGGMSSAGNTLIDGMGDLATIMNRSGAQGDSPLTLWKRAISDDRFMTRDEQRSYFQAWEYWRTLHAHMLVMNLEYANSAQGVGQRRFIPIWTDQFARRGNPGNATEGPGLANWYANAGLDKIQLYLTPTQVFDRGTGLMWNSPNLRPPRTSLEQVRGDVTGTVVYPYSVPSGDQIWSLFRAQGGGYLGQAESGYSSGIPYLKDNGFDIGTCEALYGRNPDNGIDGVIRIDNQVEIMNFDGHPYLRCVPSVWKPPVDIQPVPPRD